MGDLLPALDGVIDTYAPHGLHPPHGTLHTALLTERARIDELAGRDGAAMARYEAVLAEPKNQQSGLGAGLGLLRTASRMAKVRKEEAPLLKAEKPTL